MSNYRQYQEARNTAWRALLRLPEKKLPVDAEALAREIGIEVLPWPDPKENGRLWHFAQQVPGVCISLRIRGKWHIFVRGQRLSDSRRRFAVAHEVGHLLLCHETLPLAPGVRRFASDENTGDLMDDPQELCDYAADMFAIRLLSPACLLHEMRVDTPGGIASLCGLPPRAAALRAERMDLLNQRNAFYRDPLERQVRSAFQGYLSPARMGVPPQSPGPLPLVMPPRERREPVSQPLKETPPPKPAPKKKRLRFSRRASRIAEALLAAAALIIFFLLGRNR